LIGAARSCRIVGNPGRALEDLSARTHRPRLREGVPRDSLSDAAGAGSFGSPPRGPFLPRRARTGVRDGSEERVFIRVWMLAERSAVEPPRGWHPSGAGVPKCRSRRVGVASQCCRRGRVVIRRLLRFRGRLHEREG
jgi:hypothetical protein